MLCFATLSILCPMATPSPALVTSPTRRTTSAASAESLQRGPKVGGWLVTSSSSPSYAIVILVVAFILIRVSRRVLASHKGARFSISRTYTYTAVYVLVGAGFSGLSYTEGVPYALALPEIAIAAGAAVGSYLYSDRRITFWKEGEALYFRGGVIIYVIYLVGLVARLSLDIVFLGPAAFSFATATLTGTALYSTMATDLLLILGVGLLLGRAVRLAKRYGKISRGEEKVEAVKPAT